MVLPELPQLPNGKLDRKALPAPQAHAARRRKGFAAPATELQKKVAEIWQRVLSIERVGLHDNFFEIGGDSLLGLRVVNRLREVLSEHVSLVVIFEAPTVAAARAGAGAKLRGGAAGAGWALAPKAARPTRRRARRSGCGKMPAAHYADAAVSGGGPKNPPAIFILSPMRSGSTLLRIMLAGNPRLFSPPELQLLQFETLAERKAAYVRP